jgi:hypothetical protein
MYKSYIKLDMLVNIFCEPKHANALFIEENKFNQFSTQIEHYRTVKIIVREEWCKFVSD